MVASDVIGVYGMTIMLRQIRQGLQAEIAELDLGRWWMLEDPSRSAEVL